MNVASKRPTSWWAEFGHELRRWRRLAGLTQAQVGARIGYSHSAVSKLENGFCAPAPAIARQLDALLHTGGQLTAIWHATNDAKARKTLAVVRAKDPAPLPAIADSPAGDVTATGGHPWPSRLPIYGLVCPLHGNIGCLLPAPEAALCAYAAIRDAGLARHTPPGTNSDIVHGLTAMLAAHTAAEAESTSDNLIASVEQVLHTIARWAHLAPDTPPQPQWRLAAHYAQLAGRLRMERGQNGLAMAWYSNALRWATHADDLPLRATLLSDMSTVARLEHDAHSALGYARAIGALAPRRHWVAALCAQYQARGHALNADPRQCHHSIQRCRSRFDHAGERDWYEAPWLAGAQGHARMECGIGGALRDIAAKTTSRSAARLAIKSTEQALAHFPPQMRPFHLLLTVRLADNYACAGEPVSAIAIAEQVLGEAAAAHRLRIRRELAGLRGRLCARWGNLPQVRDFTQRLGDHIA